MNNEDIKETLNNFIKYCEEKGMVSIYKDDYGEYQPRIFYIENYIEDFINENK